jgi:ribose transport system permease protein
MKSVKSAAQRLAESGLIVPVLFAVVLISIYASLSPGALSPTQIKYTLINASLTLALAAAGLAFVVLVGGLDMSAAGVIAVTNAVLTINFGGGVGQQALWVLISIALGALAGLINGLIVTTFRLEPVVVTLATGFIYSGLALLMLPKPRGLEPVEGFSVIGFVTSDIGGVPVGLLVMLLVVLGWVFLRRSRLGAQLISVGSDEESAQYSGIKVRKVKLVAFSLAGALYGLAGVALTSQTSGGDSQIGSAYLLGAFAAVVVGGLRLGGGRGSVIGAMLGAFCVTILVNVLFVLGFASFWGTIGRGVLLLIALGVQSIIAVTILQRNRQQSITLEGASA